MYRKCELCEEVWAVSVMKLMVTWFVGQFHTYSWSRKAYAFLCPSCNEAVLITEDLHREK